MIKKLLPKFPHHKNSTIEKILRKVHFTLFKKYYTKRSKNNYTKSSNINLSKTITPME
jgi:hypothetical protein